MKYNSYSALFRIVIIENDQNPVRNSVLCDVLYGFLHITIGLLFWSLLCDMYGRNCAKLRINNLTKWGKKWVFFNPMQSPALLQWYISYGALPPTSPRTKDFRPEPVCTSQIVRIMRQILRFDQCGISISPCSLVHLLVLSHLLLTDKQTWVENVQRINKQGVQITSKSIL